MQFSELETREYNSYKRKVLYYSRKAQALGLPKETPMPKELFVQQFLRQTA